MIVGWAEGSHTCALDLRGLFWPGLRPHDFRWMARAGGCPNFRPHESHEPANLPFGELPLPPRGELLPPLRGDWPLLPTLRETAVPGAGTEGDFLAAGRGVVFEEPAGDGDDMFLAALALALEPLDLDFFAFRTAWFSDLPTCRTHDLL